MRDVYITGDYAGMQTGRYSFYFGYEETKDDEWAFVAEVNGIEVMRKGASELTDKKGLDMGEMLLHGIALLYEETDCGVWNRLPPTVSGGENHSVKEKL